MRRILTKFTYIVKGKIQSSHNLHILLIKIPQLYQVKFYLYRASRSHSRVRPNFQQLSYRHFCSCSRPIDNFCHIRKLHLSNKIPREKYKIKCAAIGGKQVDNFVENYLICPHLRNLKKGLITWSESLF